MKPIPGECPYETHLLDGDTNKPKSCCTVRGREIWVNCRISGECYMAPDGDQIKEEQVFDDDDEPEDEHGGCQMSLFD